MKTISEIIKDVDTDDKIFERVELCLNDFKTNFVRLGYMLRVLKERGYDNAYLQDRFGLSKSSINRCIQVNEQFSENGYSYKLDDKYADFNKSQLIEMLPLSDEQREEVTADMSIADIRELKNQEEEEPEEDIIEQEEIEESDDLPEFNSNNDSATTYKWIFDTLAAMPEVGPDINIQENFLKSNKCKNILINKEMDLYISSEHEYYIRFTSSKYKISSWFYGFISSYVKSEYVLNNSSEEYIQPFDTWKLKKELSKYLINQITDFDTLVHDDLFGWLIENCTLGFDLDDEISVTVGVDAFDCKRKTRHCFVEFKDIKGYFETDRLDLMNAFVDYVIRTNFNDYSVIGHIGKYDILQGIGICDIEFLILRDIEDPDADFIYVLYSDDYPSEPLICTDGLLYDFFDDYDMKTFVTWISCLNISSKTREQLFFGLY